MGKVNIELQSLKLTYFKGVRKMEINFQHITNIYGDNETFKSTIPDAFNWLLFGKNIFGHSDTKFGIKTKANGKVIPRVDHIVEAVFNVGGEIITAKRILKEKWPKKKGSSEAVFDGNETVYYWNEVPETQAEFKKNISNLIDEDVFKLLTDPLAFNNLHWEKARQILLAIEPGETDENIAKGNKAFEELLTKLSNKTLDKYNKQLNATRLSLKKEIEVIPTRIDEVLNGKPLAQDFEGEEKNLLKLEKELNSIESQIDDRNKALEKVQEERTKKSNTVFQLKSTNQNLEFEIKTAVKSELSNSVDPTAILIKELNLLKEESESGKNRLERRNEELSAEQAKLPKAKQDYDNKSLEWEKENARELHFDAHSFSCPSCKRPLEANDIEAEKAKMIEDFKEDKTTALANINREGAALKTLLSRVETIIEDLKVKCNDGKKWLDIKNAEIKAKQGEIDKLSAGSNKAVASPEEMIEQRLKAHAKYQANIKEIATLEKELENIQSVDIADLKEERVLI